MLKQEANPELVQNHTDNGLQQSRECNTWEDIITNKIVLLVCGSSHFLQIGLNTIGKVTSFGLSVTSDFCQPLVTLNWIAVNKSQKSNPHKMSDNSPQSQKTVMMKKAPH